MTKKKSCFKSKCLKIIGIILIVLLGLGIVGVIFADHLIKVGIETVGSAMTKCDISVERVRLALLRGHLRIENLAVGNPEGYNTPNAFTLTKIQIDMVPLSVLSKKIHVKEVQIIDPKVTYEVAPLKFQSNIGAIQKNITAFLPAGDDDKEEKKEEKEEKKEGKKVQIDHVLIDGGQINVSATIAGGHSLPVPLPKIEMNDIGKDKDVSTPEASASILNRMFTGVIDAGNEAIKKIGAGLQGVGEAIGSGGKAIGEGFKSLGNKLFGGKDGEEKK